MSRLEHNWQSENSGASDGRQDSSESERLEQVARSLSPSSPLLRSAASEGDNDGSERVRSRRSRNSWTTVQARRAVDNHQRLRSVPDVHQSSGRPWTHQPGGQDESPSSLLPGASSAYQSREQQPWEQHQQRRYRSRQSVPASLSLFPPSLDRLSPLLLFVSYTLGRRLCVCVCVCVCVCGARCTVSLRHFQRSRGNSGLT
jgi:hypothetical protein